MRFSYYRCKYCLTFFNVDVPDDIGIYYPKEYYNVPSIDLLEKLSSGESPRLEMLQKVVASGELIEIGSGFGIFALAAKRAGFTVTAIEMDSRCCEYLVSAVGVNVVCSDAPNVILKDLSASSAIAMWHSLEHFPNPWDVLDSAVDNLKWGGALIIAMPNPDSVQFRLLGKRWAHVDAPRHLFLIPLSALEKHLAGRGLKLVNATSNDPSGQYWNLFGWEYAMRKCPKGRPPTKVVHALSMGLTLFMRPFERRKLAGAAYTAVFVKEKPSE